MLSVTFLYHYIEFYYAECRYAEWHYAECRYAEWHYGECLHAECHYDECHDAFYRTEVVFKKPLTLILQSLLSLRYFNYKRLT